MIVTPFADFLLEDEVALARYLDAHKRRHAAYVPLARTPGGTLDGPVDADWMHRHAARTITLCTVASINLSSADTKALALPWKWRTQQELRDWMDLDARIHLKLDRQLGIT